MLTKIFYKMQHAINSYNNYYYHFIKIKNLAYVCVLSRNNISLLNIPNKKYGISQFILTISQT